jgi:hypothetical protein
MSSSLETRSVTGRAGEIRISPLAGKPASREMLVDVARLEREYYECHPDLQDLIPTSSLASALIARMCASVNEPRCPPGGGRCF